MSREDANLVVLQKVLSIMRDFVPTAVCPWPGLALATPFEAIPLPGDDQRGPPADDESLVILLAILLLLLSVLFLLLVFVPYFIFLRRQRISLTDDGGPTNLEREDEIDGDGGLNGVEQRWMEGVEEPTRVGYLRSKVWQSHYPPNSQPTDINLSQFLSIQENPAPRSPSCRTASGWPRRRAEGVPSRAISPYPSSTRSTTGNASSTKNQKPPSSPSASQRSRSQASDCQAQASTPSATPPPTASKPTPTPSPPNPTAPHSQRATSSASATAPALAPYSIPTTVRSSETPTSASTSNTTSSRPSAFHVNLGQAGFVFIEAIVKKWGLAPMVGTLAPPPEYGNERESVLLEAGGAGGSGEGSVGATPSRADPRSGRRFQSTRHKDRRNDPPMFGSTSTATSPVGAVSALGTPSTSSQPIRPSPFRHSNLSAIYSSASASTSGSASSREDEDVQNPPTPGVCDVSLQSLQWVPQDTASDDEDCDAAEGNGSNGSHSTPSEEEEPHPIIPEGTTSRPAGPSQGIAPPAYFPIDPNRYPAGVAELMLSDIFASNPSLQLASVAAFQNYAGGQAGGRYDPPGTASEVDNNLLGEPSSSSSWLLGWLGRRPAAPPESAASLGGPSAAGQV